jgi:thiol-disulfide isomerase/thioredoxin
MYAFKWFAEPMMVSGSDDVANSALSNGEVQLYIFLADWCPHCKKAKPEWLNFKSAYDGKQINGQTLKLISVDCTDGTDPLIQKYQINGYPTAFIMNGKQRIDFDSRITEANLVKFINTILD